MYTENDMLICIIISQSVRNKMLCETPSLYVINKLIILCICPFIICNFTFKMLKCKSYVLIIKFTMEYVKCF